MFLVPLAVLALAATLILTPGGRRTFARLRGRQLLMPAALALLGALLAVKGELFVGGGLVLGALLWSGRTQRSRGTAIEEGAVEGRRREARALLGVSPYANRETIVAAHRQLIARHHPDAGGATEIAARLNLARDLLLDDHLS
jgi:hypothetical protein